MKKNRNIALLKQSEIIHFTGISKEYPTCNLRNIRKVERKEFRECLGKAFYDFLKENLETYDCTPWDKNKTYEIGDVVPWKGVFYKATKETMAQPPLNTDWEFADKFKKDCLNELWCEGSLGEYLSWVVLKNRLPHNYVKLEAAGLVKFFGQNFNAIDYKDFQAIMKTYEKEIFTSFEEVDEYMREENEEGCFDLYKGISKGCCGECGCLDAKCTCEDNCLDAKESQIDTPLFG